MTCVTCSRPFEAKRKDHRFCSATCRLAAFHAKDGADQRERDDKIRLLLRTATESLDAARQLLREPDDDAAEESA